MKNLILMITGMVLLTGCAIANVETKGKGIDGATCKASYSSAFKSLTDVEMKACGAQGQAGSATIDPQTAVLMDLFLKALAAKQVLP